MTRRVVEWVKTLLIVLLTCSALVLAVMANADDLSSDLTTTRWFSGLFDRSTGDLTTGTAFYAQTAAWPTTISLESDAGRTSLRYDTQQLLSAYERFGGLLGQALEMAGDAEPCDMAAVETALTQPSVYFAYPGAVPLSALAQWLEAEYAGDGAASWFVLSIAEDAVTLYFGTDAQANVSRTYLQTERLARELENFRPDGTVFAFEQAELAALDPLTVVDLQDSAAIYQTAAASAWDDSFVAETASQLGFNPYGDGYYTESDGTVVFSESGCTLRISPNGTVALTNQERGSSRFSAAESSAAAQIEAVRALLDTLTDGRLGEAELFLTEYTEEEGTTTISFSYYINGIPIRLTDGAAATATLDGTTLTALTVRVRNYETLSRTVTLLPVRQAYALAPTGANLHIGYADTGDGELTAGWMP